MPVWDNVGMMSNRKVPVPDSLRHQYLSIRAKDPAYSNYASHKDRCRTIAKVPQEKRPMLAAPSAEGNLAPFADLLKNWAPIEDQKAGATKFVRCPPTGSFKAVRALFGNAHARTIRHATDHPEYLRASSEKLYACSHKLATCGGTLLGLGCVLTTSSAVGLAMTFSGLLAAGLAVGLASFVASAACMLAGKLVEKRARKQLERAAEQGIEIQDLWSAKANWRRRKKLIVSELRKSQRRW